MVEGPATATPEADTERPVPVTDVANSLVGVHGDGRRGSGIIMDANGTILTSSRLVAGGDSSSVIVRLPDGDSVRGHVLARKPLAGLALLQVPRRELPVGWKERRGPAPRRGELVYLAAYLPGQGEWDGTGFVPDVQAERGGVRVFPVVPTTRDTTLPEGTAVVSREGHVVGMITSRQEPGNMMWTAVSLDPALDTLATSWKQPALPGKIGAIGTTVTPAMVRDHRLSRVSGFLVQQRVSPTTSLKPGDIVFQLDDSIQVDGRRDLDDAVATLPPNSVVRLKVRRGTKDTTISELVIPGP